MPLQQRANFVSHKFLWPKRSLCAVGFWNSPTLLKDWYLVLCVPPLFHSTSHTFIFCLFVNPSLFFIHGGQITSQPFIFYLKLPGFVTSALASVLFSHFYLFSDLYGNFIILKFMMFLPNFINSHERDKNVICRYQMCFFFLNFRH